MIVPKYWAEGRVVHRDKGRQVTIRRFGWSNLSEAEAQVMAERRAKESLERVLVGETLPRRDQKVPYNGSEGVPIREEIVATQGETIITRNSYGARCLNTPNVLLADIDFDSSPSLSLRLVAFFLSALVAIIVGVSTGSTLLVAGLLFVTLILSHWVAVAVHRLVERLNGGSLASALRGVQNYVQRHPESALRVYQTPAGLRVVMTHRTFVPSDPEVAACFRAWKVDPMYARMCVKQQCFRARVSAKPWRIGIEAHIRPRPGVWPVAPDRLPERMAWITQYEAVAESFAACQFLEEMGTSVVDRNVAPVLRLHDEMSKATSGLPIA